MSRKVARLLAPILGAEADDIMIGQSTTVNLHQLLATFHQPGKRILIDEWSFPSDRYAIASHLPLRYQDPGTDMIVVPNHDGLIDTELLLEAMDHHVGMAVLPAVAYRSGQLLDVSRLTHEARGRNVLVAWDCSHSAGVIPHRFRADDIDLAFGCTYKYLNGGPGSPGWLYVHPRLRDRLPGLAGWFGSDPTRQFEMSFDMHPAEDAGRYKIGTPHVLSLAPLLGALQLINQAGIDRIRAKSVKLLRFMFRRLYNNPNPVQYVMKDDSPTDYFPFGSHLIYRDVDAGRLSRALRAHGVIADYRPPDLLRLAVSPLYTSFAETDKAIDILTELLVTRDYRKFSDENDLVT
jgi:kynureninase